MTNLQFPPSFVWGTATASYQIEGGAQEDGRGESIWDRFSHTPGKIEDGSTGDVACDHYHRWPQDIAMMRDLGLKAYRFSIAWPRILPQGRGPVNQAGIDFYSKLVDGLLEAGITPYATLYHWDLPQVLQDKGGWPARETAEAYVEYADVISKALGDRVKRWITHNEPWCASILSYLIGEHAPGLHDGPAALRAAHHLLLSHGWAVPVLRQNSPDSEVGITLNFNAFTPYTDSPGDAQAVKILGGAFNNWFADPLFKGTYPDYMVEAYKRQGFLGPEGMDFVHERDLDAISAPLDFLGVNYYSRAVVGADDLIEPEVMKPSKMPADAEVTEMGWEVYPEGLYQILKWLDADYDIPKLYITENGVSYSDGPGADGKVHDERRIKYLREHFASAKRAMDEGVKLSGYFVWSLMDNFEWARGYLQRFGIVWVDYTTQERIPKDSALWYKQVMESNSVEV